jgi:hypothetical protein
MAQVAIAGAMEGIIFNTTSTSLKRAINTQVHREEYHIFESIMFGGAITLGAICSARLSVFPVQEGIPRSR